MNSEGKPKRDSVAEIAAPRLSFLTFPPEAKMLVVKSSIETKVLQEKIDEALEESDKPP